MKNSAGMKRETFLKASHINKSLINAVVRGLGGWTSFKESHSDVCNHGAQNGFGYFIYYSDTVKFALKHREAIIELLNETRESIGEPGSIVEMVQNFNCLGKDDYTQDEVGQALYASNAKAKEQQQVLNALAWFALEEVCRSYESIGGV